MTMMVPFDAFFFLAHHYSIIPTNDGVMGAPSRDVKGPTIRFTGDSRSTSAHARVALSCFEHDD
jgi:hypothetical protein